MNPKTGYHNLYVPISKLNTISNKVLNLLHLIRPLKCISVAHDYSLQQITALATDTYYMYSHFIGNSIFIIKWYTIYYEKLKKKKMFLILYLPSQKVNLTLMILLTALKYFTNSVADRMIAVTNGFLLSFDGFLQKLSCVLCKLYNRLKYTKFKVAMYLQVCYSRISRCLHEFIILSMNNHQLCVLCKFYNRLKYTKCKVAMYLQVTGLLF